MDEMIKRYGIFLLLKTYSFVKQYNSFLVFSAEPELQLQILIKNKSQKMFLRTFLVLFCTDFE